METLIEKYGLADAAAMLLAAFRIATVPTDVVCWLFNAEPERAFERAIGLAARACQRRKYEDRRNGRHWLDV